MQNYNPKSRNSKTAESGHVYKEVLTNAQGTLELLQHTPFRVRATGATTVTINGVLAATMSSGEIIFFNAGIANVNKNTATIVIAGANAYVQIAQ